MLKLLFVLLLIVIIFLLLCIDYNDKKIQLTERQNRLNVLNLSGSSSDRIRSKNISSLNQLNQINKSQRTCCNSYYELSDKYSLAKLNRICDMVPIEIKCMRKCLQIRPEKRLEFNLEVSDRIEEWIEQRISFQEVICIKIKKEISAHTKQMISNVLPIEIAKIDHDRLSKEEVFELIKSISNNLGLHQMNGFENEFLYNDDRTDEIIVNKRGMEIMKHARLISKLLSEENQKRSVAKNRNLKLNKLTTNQLNHLNSKNNQNTRPTQNYQYNYHHLNSYYKQMPQSRKKSVDHLDENQSNQSSKIINHNTTEPNQNSEIINHTPTEPNEKYQNYQCVAVQLNQTIVDQLLKTYPNLTISKIENQNKHHENDSIKNDKIDSINQRNRRTLFSIFRNKQSKPDQNDSVLATKLIGQFASSSSHEKIVDLANEVMRNESTDCQQEYLPNLTELLGLNLKLKTETNDFKLDKTQEINDLCNQILQIGSKLSFQLEKCNQSNEIDFMIRHTFNDTAASFVYCMNSDFDDNFKNTGDQVSESNQINQHIDLNDKTETNQIITINELNQLNQTNQLNISSINDELNKLVDCLNWNKLKLCQNRFIPWFELVEIKELKQMVDNKSMKFNELNLFKRDAFKRDALNYDEINYANGTMDSSNCKDIMLFENCVKHDLDNRFKVSLDERNGKFIEFNEDSSTCQFGIHRLNRVALINSLTTKLTNQINERVSTVCPRLNRILGLNDLDQEEENRFHRNLRNHFNQKYIGK